MLLVAVQKELISSDKKYMFLSFHQKLLFEVLKTFILLQFAELPSTKWRVQWSKNTNTM